jgi:hypothetical protein
MFSDAEAWAFFGINVLLCCARKQGGGDHVLNTQK